MYSKHETIARQETCCIYIGVYNKQWIFTKHGTYCRVHKSADSRVWRGQDTDDSLGDDSLLGYHGLHKALEDEAILQRYKHRKHLDYINVV